MNPMSQLNQIHNSLFRNSLPPTPFPIPNSINKQHNLLPSQNHERVYHYKTKRKMPLNFDNFSEEETIKEKVQKLQTICKGQESIHNKWLSQMHQWVYDEYFIANSDKQYYSQVQMKEIITHILGTQDVTFQKFKLLKKALPNTKLFTNKLINSHQDTLERFRNTKRKKMFFKRPIFNLDEKKVPNLHTGDSVWAVHPVCQHIHSGNILAQYKEDIYMIKFNKIQLGTYKIPDYQISSLFLQPQRKIPQLKSIVDFGPPNTSLDHQVLASYLSFLEYKSQLITKMQQYNDSAVKAKELGISLSQKKLQQYGWIGSQITLINMVLKHFHTNYPLSLNKPIRTQKVPKIPLIFPSSHYQINSGTTISDESQEKKEQEKQRQKEIHDNLIDQLCSKFDGSLVDRQIVEITKTIFGILVGLNSYKIQERYLTQLQKLIGSKYPQQFQSIWKVITTLFKS